MPTPIYTTENCRNPAYQLNWSYSLFWHSAPSETSWLEPLQLATEPDGIRILQHQLTKPTVSQFLVSTLPGVSPQTIAQRVKGRLQYLVRAQMPTAFQRNYALRSIGSADRETIDNYVSSQLDHHPCADLRVTEQLIAFQIHNPDVDLSRPSQTSHATHWFNLHLVLVTEGRFREIRVEPLRTMRDMVLNVSSSKGHLLSRAALLPDHLHITIRCKIDDSPQEVALTYLNNLAFAQGMRPVFRFGYFVGTFGEYDLGVIRCSGQSSLH
jgi:REP element-mobilizing transposase RayT